MKQLELLVEKTCATSKTILRTARCERGIFEVAYDDEDHAYILSYARVKYGLSDALPFLQEMVLRAQSNNNFLDQPCSDVLCTGRLDAVVYMELRC